MKRKDALEKLGKPGVKVLLFAVYPLTAAFIAGSVACILTGYTGAVSYLVYGGAAVLLVYSVYTAVASLYPRIKGKVVGSAVKHRFTREFVQDYGFRTLVFACISFAVNAAYAVFEGVMGIVYHSVWRGCLSVYYIILTVVRGIIIVRERACRKRGEDEYESLVRRIRVYGMCGGGLVVLDLAMCGAVTLMILTDNTVAYPGLSIFMSAAYTFYKIIAAAVHLSKAKKTYDPVVQALRNINLADALISVAALETAMLASFGGGEDMIPLRAATGFAVCAATVVMGALMAARAAAESRRLRAGMGTVRFGAAIKGADSLVYARECGAPCCASGKSDAEADFRNADGGERK